MSKQQTEISQVGEFGLIEKIRRIVDIRVDDATLHQNIISGISDDCAVVRPTPGKVQLVTTDVLVEGVHFDLTFTSFKHLGWKSLAVNLSDIAAMGGTPRYAVVTLCLPKKISMEMIEEFYEGLVFACKKYSVLVVGGDTSASLANMAVSIALTGEADEQHVIYRHGAKVGDYICVSGHLGASVAGLKVLQREKQRFTQSPTTFAPNLEPYAPAIERHLMPKPRLDLSRILAQEVSVNAMIDISDGLASEIHHICRESKTGAAIYERNLPVVAMTQNIAAEFSEPVSQYALYGGEEYELLFTLTEQEFEKLDHLTNDVTIIGRITEPEKGIVLVREQGEEEPLHNQGWDHFKKST